jgi:DNA repair protein SbcC/Rad50
MLIRSVRLHNIRSYLDETIDFIPGSTLLYGDIGSGKSTILLAIEFGIFGIVRGSVSGASLLRHGKNEGSVELHLTINNKEIIIKRFLKRSKNIAQDAGYVVVDGYKTEGTPIELKSMILDLLGYPDELITKNKSLIYRFTVYTPQEEMKAILFEDQEERLNTLRRVFGIDKYKKVQDNSVLLQRAFKTNIQLHEARLEGYAETELKLKLASDSKQRCMDELDQLKIEVVHVDEAIRAAKKQLVEEEERVREQSSLHKELELIENQLKINTKRLHEYQQQLLILDEKLSELTDELDNQKEFKFSREELEHKEKLLEETITKIQSQQTTIIEKMRSLQEQLDTLPVFNALELELQWENVNEQLRHKESFEHALMEKQGELSEHTSKVSVLFVGIEQAQSTIQTLQDMNQCPVCLQNVEDEHKSSILEKERKTISKLEKERSQLMESNAKLQLDCEDLKTKLSAIAEVAIKKKEIELLLQQASSVAEQKLLLSTALEQAKDQEVHLAQYRIEEKKQNLHKIKRAMQELQLRSEKKTRLTELQQSKEKLTESQTSLQEENTRAITRISFITKRVQEFPKTDVFLAHQRQHDELQKKEKELLVKQATLQKEHAIVAQQIDECAEKIRQFKVYKQKLIKLQKYQLWLQESFLQSIAMIEKQVMATIHYEFNDLLKDWFSLLIAEDAMTVSLREDFTPLIQQNGYDTDIELLSGGEKTSLALAYRLSLNRVINDLISTIQTKNLVILDEPTDGFSSEQLDRLREVFEKLSVRQILVVSHEQKLESYVQNVIRIVKTDHVSRLL